MRKKPQNLVVAGLERIVTCIKFLRMAGYLSEREHARKLGRLRKHALELGYEMIDDDVGAEFKPKPKRRRATT